MDQRFAFVFTPFKTAAVKEVETLKLDGELEEAVVNSNATENAAKVDTTTVKKALGLVDGDGAPPVVVAPAVNPEKVKDVIETQRLKIVAQVNKIAALTNKQTNKLPVVTFIVWP